MTKAGHNSKTIQEGLIVTKVLASSFSSEKRLQVKIEELEFVISENNKPFRKR